MVSAIDVMEQHKGYEDASSNVKEAVDNAFYAVVGAFKQSSLSTGMNDEAEGA